MLGSNSSLISNPVPTPTRGSPTRGSPSPPTPTPDSSSPLPSHPNPLPSLPHHVVWPLLHCPTKDATSAGFGDAPAPTVTADEAMAPDWRRPRWVLSTEYGWERLLLSPNPLPHPRSPLQSQLASRPSEAPTSPAAWYIPLRSAPPSLTPARIALLSPSSVRTSISFSHAVQRTTRVLAGGISLAHHAKPIAPTTSTLDLAAPFCSPWGSCLPTGLPLVLSTSAASTSMASTATCGPKLTSSNRLRGSHHCPPRPLEFLQW